MEVLAGVMERAWSGVDACTWAEPQSAGNGAGSGAVANVRLTSVTYPDGREVAYHYTGDAVSDKLSRVSSIGDLQSP